jgi:hypothetical protein
MAVKSRGKHVLGGLHTGINTKHITAASKMVLHEDFVPLKFWFPFLLEYCTFYRFNNLCVGGRVQRILFTAT